MTSVALGALAAVTASALFSVGLVLQAHEARTLPGQQGFGLSVVRGLARHPRWLLGVVVVLIGFGFHVGALTVAPLTVVQPALAAGLLVLLAVGLRDPDETIDFRDMVGVVGIIVGVVMLTFTTPERSESEGDPVWIALALGALTVFVLAAHVVAVAITRANREGSLLATFGAGAAYAMTGITTKFFADSLGDGQWGAAVLWLAFTGLVALMALVDQTSALQKRTVVEVGPILFVVPVIVPVVLAPALVGEGWADAPHGVAPLVIALAVVCASAGLLGGSSTVASGMAATDLAAGPPTGRPEPAGRSGGAR